MRQSKRLTLGLSSLLGCVLAVSGQMAEATPDGSEIVKKMAERYRAAKSYQDEGVVRSLSGSKAIDVNAFKTYFVRPKKLRFEWIDAKSRDELYVIWSDGGDIFSSYPFRETEKEESLEMAVAGATGISRGSAHSIPVLLLTEASGFKVTEMDRLALVREEVFEKTNCFVVRGFHPFGFAIDLWIGKDDLLIRRILEHNDDGTSDEEIRRNVRIDHEIAPELFRFNPAKRSNELIGCLSLAVIPTVLAVSSGLCRKRFRINT